MKYFTLKVYIILVGVMAIAACGEYHSISGEDHGNIAAGEASTRLVYSEHEIGWGKADCFECHSAENIHRTDRTGSGVGVDAIREITKVRGIESCPDCHGANGVE